MEPMKVPLPLDLVEDDTSTVASESAIETFTSPKASEQMPVKSGKRLGACTCTTTMDRHITEWCIARAPKKLVGCAGKPMVSPAFSALNMDGFRIMVALHDKSAFEGKMPICTQKSRRNSRGGQRLCVQLKVPDGVQCVGLEFLIRVGSVSCGPFLHDCSSGAVSSCCYPDVDWKKEVDDDQSLTVTIEIRT